MFLAVARPACVAGECWGKHCAHVAGKKREREKLHRVMHVNFSWQKRSNCVIERIMYVIGFEPMGEPHG